VPAVLARHGVGKLVRHSRRGRQRRLGIDMQMQMGARSVSATARRNWLMAGVAACCMAIAPLAQAQDRSARTHTVNIAAQPLPTALRELAAATGIQFAYSTSAISAERAPAVTGVMTTEEALATLLAGTSLGYRFTGANTVAISPLTTASTEDGVVELGTIDVSAGGETAPGDVEVGEEEIERIDPSDLQDLFSREPGIAVGSSLPMSQKVYVHGVEETNLNVTIDGGRQNNKIFHHSATNLIDPSLMKAVSIDAGVAPADAGPGALGGSIAYETKDAKDLLEPGRNFGGFLNGSYETNGDTVTTGASAYGLIDGFEYLGYINYAHGNDFVAGDDSVIFGSGMDLLSGLGKVAYEADSGDRFEFSYERVADDALRPFRANIGSVDSVSFDTRRYTMTRQNVVFTYTDQTPTGWWDPKVVLAYGVTDLEVLEPWGSTGRTGSFNGKAENRFAFDLGSITAGVDFYSDRARYADPDYSAIENASNLGLYAQARLEPIEPARLSFGVRGDHQWFEGTDGSTFDNAGVSGNVSGEFDITDWLMARAGVSRVWGGIPLAENFIANPDWDYGAGPVPVTSENYVAGLMIHHRGFTLEGSVFQTDIHDARTPSWASAIASRDFRTRGFEVGGGYNWGNGFVRAKFARVDATIDDAVADSYFGQYLGTPLGDIISLEIAHTFVDWGLTLGADAQIALKNTKTTVTEGKVLPGYEVANLFVEYVPLQFPNLTLRGEVNNIFDETYADRATYGQDFVGVVPLLEPGRSFKISATARF
jgi:hemoglobin/transferrin/lactoferrin receptor protein